MYTTTAICFGSSVKGYACDNSDRDVIWFDKLPPKCYLKDFVDGHVRKNHHQKADDQVQSDELIGLRGVFTGKYAYLAYYQYQIKDPNLKALVAELSAEYWDRIYNVVRRSIINPNRILGKNALQQMYQFQMGRYIGIHKNCPDFHFKMPDCFDITNTPHIRQFYQNCMRKRDDVLDQYDIDALWKQQPEPLVKDDHQHNDDLYREKIFNFIMNRE